MKNRYGRKDASSINSYQLSPDQLSSLHKKYGRPGEIAPGQPATRKRNRFDQALSKMDRHDKNGVMPLSEDLALNDEVKL